MNTTKLLFYMLFALATIGAVQAGYVNQTWAPYMALSANNGAPVGINITINATAGSDIKLNAVYIGSTLSSDTRAMLYNSACTLLSTATITSGKAIFTANNTLTNGSNYFIETDNGGSARNWYYNTTVSMNTGREYLKFMQGVSGACLPQGASDYQISTVELLFNSTTPNYFTINSVKDYINGTTFLTYAAMINGSIYATTNGSINTAILKSLGAAVEVDIYGVSNYFINYTLNYNTSINMDASIVPYAAVIGSDAYDNSTLTSITVQYNGTNYTGNPARVPVGLMAFNATVFSSNYFQSNITNGNGTAQTSNSSLTQAAAYFIAREMVTNTSIPYFTVTTPNVSNTNNTPYLPLKAQAYNIAFNNASWYASTISINPAAVSNITYNFTAYRYILNLTLRNVGAGTDINNFSAQITSALYGYAINYTTTNGSILAPWPADTNINITILNSSPAIAPASTALNVSGTTPLLINKSISAFTQNSVFFNIKDASTLAYINQSTNITLYGSTVTYNFATSNGTYFAQAINADHYTLYLAANTYNPNTLLLTTAGDYQNITYYLSQSTSAVTFSVSDTLGAQLSHITVTFSQNINGTVVTYAQRVTDFSGVFTLNLNPAVTYLITAFDPSGTYETFTGSVTPSQPTTYAIHMTFANPTSYPTTLNNTYTNPQAIYNSTANTINVTWEVNSPNGALLWFALNTTYVGVPYSQNISGIVGGGIASVLIPAVNLAVEDTINVTFGFRNTGFNALQYTLSYQFFNVTTTNTTLQGAFTTAPKNPIGRAMIGSLILAVAAGSIYALTSSGVLAGVVGIIIIGVLSTPSIAMFPLLYGLISCVAAAIVILADVLTGGLR